MTLIRTAFRRAAVAAIAVVVGVRLAIGTAGAADLDRLEVRTATATHIFTVEFVDTEATREKGLMFRTEMAPDHGMLFDFRREEPVWFWMRNTYLPLDMIFARADGTIVSIAADTTPLSEAPIGSGGAVRFVLEVGAGTAKRLAIAPGDHIVHPRIRSGS